MSASRAWLAARCTEHAAMETTPRQRRHDYRLVDLVRLTDVVEFAASIHPPPV